MIMGGRHLDTSDIHCRSESGYIRYCLYTNKNLPSAVQSDENVEAVWLFPGFRPYLSIRFLSAVQTAEAETSILLPTDMWTTCTYLGHCPNQSDK